MSDGYEPLRAKAAEYRHLAKRHSYVKISPREMAELTDTLVRIMTALEATVAERDALLKRVEAAAKPKYAPFAPARRTTSHD